MRYILVALLTALIVSRVTATPSNVVFCKEIAKINGPVVMFEGYCPVGWYQV